MENDYNDYNPWQQLYYQLQSSNQDASTAYPISPVPAKNAYGNGNADYTNDISSVHSSSHDFTPVNHNAHTRQLKPGAPQRRSRRENEALEGSTHYVQGGAQVQYIGHAAPSQPAAGHGDYLQQQQKPLVYTDNQRFRSSQAAPFQGTASITPGYGNSQRASQTRGSTVHQAPGYPQLSSMQNFVARMGSAPAPSTSSGASGSTGATFSSVSTNEQGGFRRGPDASLHSTLPYYMEQLQITNNFVHGQVSAPYGQVPGTVTTRHQDTCSHCQACIHTYCHPPAHYPPRGDHATAGVVRIGYCPIPGCNRGPGSNRPFPRTCNLLEHLRGVHREDIPRGAKLKTWLVSQGYDPDKLVECVKPRS